MNEDRTPARILKIGLALGIAGTVYVLIARGPRESVGFLTGAGLSLLSFHTLRRLGEALVPGAGVPMRGSVLFFVLRYFIIGAVAYVIVKLLGISVMPVLAGLFVSAAAVLVEILYELVSSR
jgi:hypothetical protein